jgi:predicted Zn-dependent protease
MTSIRNRVKNLVLGFTLLASTTVTVTGCAVNPATGQRQFILISESEEIQMGRDADGPITESLGLYESDELQAAVSNIGNELASRSERAQLPWSFKLVDDPMVNAFALPGGFIFVTRGIMAALNSEAELAGVLGHEIGHVTARHSASQMSRQQLQQIGLGVGSILSSDVASVAGVLSVGLGLLNMRYSRGDESQSDELGVRYMTRAGYDPNALVGVFQTLGLSMGGEGRVPGWASTHPDPVNREEDIREIIATSGQDYSEYTRRGDEYLRSLDGMTFGTDPREGYFEEETFFHPDMAFALDFPRGWTTVNQKSQVGAISPDEAALVVLTVEAGESDAESALSTFLRQDDIRGSNSRRTTVNGRSGWEASFTADTEQGGLRGAVLFVEHGGAVFRLLGYAAASGWSSYENTVVGSLESFRSVSDPNVLGVEPARIEIVRIPSRMTLRQFIDRYPSTASDEQIAVINRRTLDESIAGGTLLKRVAGGRLP